MTILLENDEALAVALRSATGPDTHVVPSLAVLRQLVSADDTHDLIVVGPDVEPAVAFELAASERVSRPALGVVLVRRRLDSGLLRDALRAGIREVVASDELPALAEACQRSLALSTQIRQQQGQPLVAGASTGRLVTVFAAKGGCGKTTVATNLACALAAQGRRVCLLDLDLAFGDVAVALQLTPIRTVRDAVGLSALDETAVRSLVTGHPSGLDTILAPVEPGAAESISGALVAELCRVLKSMYDVVVVDCPPAFTDHVLAAADHTDHFVLLTTLDIPALKNLKLTLETLETLGYDRSRWQVVLNRSDAKVGLAVADVERTLCTSISVQIPSSRAVPAAVNRGVPLVLDQAGHAVSVAVRRLAAEVVSGAGGEGPRGARRVLPFRRRVAVNS